MKLKISTIGQCICFFAIFFTSFSTANAQTDIAQLNKTKKEKIYNAIQSLSEEGLGNDKTQDSILIEIKSLATLSITTDKISDQVICLFLDKTGKRIENTIKNNGDFWFNLRLRYLSCLTVGLLDCLTYTEERGINQLCYLHLNISSYKWTKYQTDESELMYAPFLPPTFDIGSNAITTIKNAMPCAILLLEYEKTKNQAGCALALYGETNVSELELVFKDKNDKTIKKYTQDEYPAYSIEDNSFFAFPIYAILPYITKTHSIELSYSVNRTQKRQSMLISSFFEEQYDDSLLKKALQM